MEYRTATKIAKRMHDFFASVFLASQVPTCELSDELAHETQRGPGVIVEDMLMLSECVPITPGPAPAEPTWVVAIRAAAAVPGVSMWEVISSAPNAELGMETLASRYAGSLWHIDAIRRAGGTMSLRELARYMHGEGYAAEPTPSPEPAVMVDDDPSSAMLADLAGPAPAWDLPPDVRKPKFQEQQDGTLLLFEPTTNPDGGAGWELHGPFPIGFAICPKCRRPPAYCECQTPNEGS